MSNHRSERRSTLDDSEVVTREFGASDTCFTRQGLVALKDLTFPVSVNMFDILAEHRDVGFTIAVAHLCVNSPHRLNELHLDEFSLQRFLLDHIKNTIVKTEQSNHERRVFDPHSPER